ncbi:2-C-methyl-D-erythritol 4-phosphate cytidylyltransferase [bacterium]|nr:2-C-methyl-D-erythritol 4-phosphate cytidylyltransferase [bacterium]
MSDATTPLHLIILAGGSGSRARAGDDARPKQFAVAAGRILLGWSAHALVAHPAVASLTVTCAGTWRDTVAPSLPDHPATRFADPGPTRTASTWSALEVLRGQAAPGEDDLVAVHDAARPFVGTDLLGRLYEAALEAGGAVPGVPVADTIVTSRPADEGAVSYLDRDTLFAVQTPQVFRWSLLHDVHAWAAAEGAAFTDDGGLLAARGEPPVIVPGDETNWKITTSADLVRACELLEASG